MTVVINSLLTLFASVDATLKTNYLMHHSLLCSRHHSQTTHFKRKVLLRACESNLTTVIKISPVTLLPLCLVTLYC